MITETDESIEESTKDEEPTKEILARLRKLSDNTAYEFTPLELDSLNKKLALDMANANNYALFDDIDKPQLHFLEKEIATQKKIEPEDKEGLEAAKKHFFMQLVLSFSEQDNALRSEKSQKLEKETGQKFNFWANIKSAELMNSLYSKPEQAKALLRTKDSETLMQTALAFYLDSWSRHFHEDQEYAACFQPEDDYLVNSYLPIVNNQLFIPDVYLNTQAVSHDLQTAKITRRFIPSHFDGFKLPFFAEIKDSALEFAIGNLSLGNFTSSRI